MEEPTRTVWNEPGTIARYRVALVREPSTPYDEPILCERPESLARFLGRFLADADRELFGVLLFDQRLRLIGHHVAYVGTLERTAVQPRGVFVPALLANAAAVVLFHNHPSGDPSPSPEDLAMTQRMTDAGELLGIRVLDHVIVGEKGRYFALGRRLGG